MTTLLLSTLLSNTHYWHSFLEWPSPKQAESIRLIRVTRQPWGAPETLRTWKWKKVQWCVQEWRDSDSCIIDSWLKLLSSTLLTVNNWWTSLGLDLLIITWQIVWILPKKTQNSTELGYTAMPHLTSCCLAAVMEDLRFTCCYTG